jgi:glycosyltransferase involved in cell wall biosynthesis
METSTKTYTQNLVVIIPAHNEAGRIRDTLTNIDGIRDSLAAQGLSLLTYVVDDGSKDTTRTIAQEAGATRVLRHLTHQGLGAAVRTGLAAAKDAGADIVLKMDADLQHEASDIHKLIKPIIMDEADVVYGNRFERIDYKMPFIRWVGNKVFTGLMRWLTRWPLKDSQPGIFAVSQAYLKVFKIPGDYNYTQQILLDAYHKGMRFAHVPVAFHHRTGGKSFVSSKYPFAVLTQILMVLVELKPLKVFMPIGFGFLFIAAAISLCEILLWSTGNSIKPIVHVNAVLGTGFFGLQTIFFGILAQLIVSLNKR